MLSSATNKARAKPFPLLDIPSRESRASSSEPLTPRTRVKQVICNPETNRINAFGRLKTFFQDNKGQTFDLINNRTGKVPTLISKEEVIKFLKFVYEKYPETHERMKQIWDQPCATKGLVYDENGNEIEGAILKPRSNSTTEEANSFHEWAVECLDKHKDSLVVVPSDQKDGGDGCFLTRPCSKNDLFDIFKGVVIDFSNPENSELYKGIQTSLDIPWQKYLFDFKGINETDSSKFYLIPCNMGMKSNTPLKPRKEHSGFKFDLRKETAEKSEIYAEIPRSFATPDSIPTGTFEISVLKAKKAIDPKKREDELGSRTEICYTYVPDDLSIKGY